MIEPIQIVLIVGAVLSALAAVWWLRLGLLTRSSSAQASPKQAMPKTKQGHKKAKHPADNKAQSVKKMDVPAAKLKTDKDIPDDLTAAAEYDIEHVFNTEFREELRNRGRLYFEKIINENAMFLQQDLRLTTSQLNDYMKDEIKQVLQGEFAKYEESITGAKDLAIASMEKTQAAIEEQRSALEKQLLEQVAAEKERIMTRFERDMAEVINHYVLTAIGDEIDISDQLEYIVSYLNQNKQAIVEDLSHGS